MPTTAFAVVVVTCLIQAASSHGHQHHHASPMTSLSAERGHIGHHMGGGRDVNQMAEDELRFLYFKMHDSDNNDRLDGCELVHSLLHWHAEECEATGHDRPRIFGHDELQVLVDPVLGSDDRNCDGFIDYPEFVAAQKSRGL